MEGTGPAAEEDSHKHDRKTNDPYARESLCISTDHHDDVLMLKDNGFLGAVQKTFGSGDESRALEETFKLKQKLRKSSTYEFWQILMEGMTSILGAEYAWVAKRVLHDDENAAVEMPKIGEPGSCLMGLAFYFTNHKGQYGLYRDYKYKVYGAPCQWMRHDRVLLIPDGLTKLLPNNPNNTSLPLPPEGYLAVPMWHEGKCFAHLGVMWSEEGLKSRPKLSWGIMEMFLHSLEDCVTARMMEGLGLGEPVVAKGQVIPESVVTGMFATPGKSSSLRPYARRLSHELRTPMQGVVGMLDVMYASVLEAVDPTRWNWQNPIELQETMRTLREQIEIAQDSSKRAIDAADNMVHAYDFDMQVPATPAHVVPALDITPSVQIDPPRSATLSQQAGHKRRRSSGGEEPPRKVAHLSGPSAAGHVEIQISRSATIVTPPYTNGGPQAPVLAAAPTTTNTGLQLPLTGYFAANPAQTELTGQPAPMSFDAAGKVQLNSRPLRLRQFLHEIVHDSLKSGGRPDSTSTVETPRGESILVEKSASDYDRDVINIHLEVDPTVPEVMIIDGAAVGRLLSSVFHNAVKFTPNGRVRLFVTTVPSSRQILFLIQDTGDGIHPSFVPELFKPFSLGDDSITRNREGLGLGLMVAKGIARKLGGDLWLEKSNTKGEEKGSEFRVQLPITPEDALRTPSTPGGGSGAGGSGTVTPMASGKMDFVLAEPGAEQAMSRSRANTPPATVVSQQTPVSIKSKPIEKPVPFPSGHGASEKPASKVPTPRPAKRLNFDPDLGKKVPLRVLVVEDNRINRSLLCNMLKRLGYAEISEARDGVEAVELFSSSLEETSTPSPLQSPSHVGDKARDRPSSRRRKSKAFDLVLMDLHMPRLDGFEASERILERASRDQDDEKATGKDPEWKEKSKVVVLAVSADATDEARARAAEKGIRGFLGKPFGMAELGKAVVEFCGNEVVV